jgi:hypothetical protein
MLLVQLCTRDRRPSHFINKVCLRCSKGLNVVCSHIFFLLVRKTNPTNLCAQAALWLNRPPSRVLGFAPQGDQSSYPSRSMSAAEVSNHLSLSNVPRRCQSVSLDCHCAFHFSFRLVCRGGGYACACETCRRKATNLGSASRSTQREQVRTLGTCLRRVLSAEPTNYSQMANLLPQVATDIGHLSVGLKTPRRLGQASAQELSLARFLRTDRALLHRFNSNRAIIKTRT